MTASAAAAVVVRRGGRVDAAVAAGALALAAAMTLLVPLLGAVRTSDGAPVWFAPGALWTMLLPAVLVAVLALPRPVVALAVAAGAGAMGAARLLADLPVLTDPDALARPDLFVETTDRSLPFHAAAGGYLLIAADLLALAAGVFAALRLARRLSFQPDLAGSPFPDDISETVPSPVGPRGGARPPADGADGPHGADADRGAGGVPLAGGEPDDPLGVYEAAPDRRSRRSRNNLLTAAGFVGALLLAIGALGVPYRGGYLAGRYLTVGVPLAGMVGAVLLAVLAATAVLIAGTLPRTLALGLLGGTALGACLPYLVAIVAAASAPVALSGTVWIGLVGGVALVLAGLLARARMVHGPDRDTEPGAPSPPRVLPAGIAGIVAAVLAAAAFALPTVDPGRLGVLVLTDGSPVPRPTMFLVAAAALLLAGVLALVPATAGAGRAALLVLWAAVVPGVTLSLEVLGDDGLSLARLMHLVGIGAGTWLGVAALVAAGVAAVLAAVDAHRAAQAAATVVDDESAAAARAITVPVAAGLAVLAAVAACLPVYATGGEMQGPTILHGYTVEVWGVWALLAATIGALAAAATTHGRLPALGLGLGAAVLQAVRLVIPAGLAQTTGFALRPGAVVQAVLVLALVGGALLLSRLAGRIREVDALSRADTADGPRGRRTAGPQGRQAAGPQGRQAAGPKRSQAAGRARGESVDGASSQQGARAAVGRSAAPRGDGRIARDARPVPGSRRKRR